MKTQEPSSFSLFHYVGSALLIACVGGYFLFRLISLELLPFDTYTYVEEAREVFAQLR
jgi:hypothetical protein